MNKIIYGFFIGSIGLSLVSCSDEYSICESPVYVSLNGNFYKNNAGTVTAVNPGSFSVSLLNTSASYTNASNPAGFSVPLVANADTTRFIISIEGATPDTFKVAYSTQVQHISDNCGDINTFTLTGTVLTTTHNVDSILVVNTLVNTTKVQHLKLFY